MTSVLFHRTGVRDGVTIRVTIANNRPAALQRKQKPVRIVRPGRIRKGKALARTTGGIQGWDVQKRPNFNIETTGPKTYTLSARDVNSAVYTQIVSLLQKINVEFLIVDSKKMTKKQALKYIMPALGKGSVHVELL